MSSRTPVKRGGDSCGGWLALHGQGNSVDPLGLDFEAPDGLEHQLLTLPVREGTALGWLELAVSVEVALQGIPTGIIFASHVEGQAGVAEAVQTLKRITGDGEVEGHWALGARALRFDVGSDVSPSDVSPSDELVARSFF